MGAAAHGGQTLARGLKGRGLRDQAAVEGQGLVGAQHPGVGVVTRYRQGLGPRQLDGQSGGVHARRFQGVFVNVGDLDGERHAGVGQHGAPRGALGGEDQAFAVGRHIGAPSLRLRRSLNRLMMAAAVSSTERRVTSMVGQPRRSKARRALMVSSRTESWST
ncbi:hypothetical protein D3C80_1026890 [compost metagenome]